MLWKREETPALTVEDVEVSGGVVGERGDNCCDGGGCEGEWRY